MSTVTATIKNNGQPMDASFRLVSIDIVKEVNRIPYAQLILLDGDAAKQKFEISNGSFFEPGKEIEILLRYEGDPNKDVRVFKGLVVKQIVEASAQGTLLTVEMKDSAIKLAQSRRSAVYHDKTDTDIISDLTGTDRSKLAKTELKHPEIVQYYCTDWDFMVSRAEGCGLLIIAEDGKISLKEIALNGQPDINHTFKFGISKIYNFEIEVDVSHQRASVESIAWDLKKQTLTEARKAKALNLAQGNLKAGDVANAIGGNLETLSSPVPLSLDMLQTWADAVMVKSRMSMIRGRISVPGFGDIHCMEVIEVAGIGERFNGKTLVTGVRHRIDRYGWKTDVQFGLSPERFAERRDIVDIPAAGLLPAVNGLQIGVVDKFTEDEDKEFRVKVILPGVDEKNGAIWARLASPDAGKDRGYFFRPEPGDEVVVGFFNDDPRQAVILGAMFSSKNAPPKDLSQLTKENTDKGIVTRKGTTIGFVDDEKSSVFIATPESNKIIFDDDQESIEITDQHGNSIVLSEKGIEINSVKDLKIKASGKIEITGQKVDVK